MSPSIMSDVATPVPLLSIRWASYLVIDPAKVTVAALGLGVSCDC